LFFFFFFQAEDGIRDFHVTGVQASALPISASRQAYWHRRILSILSLLPRAIPKLHFIWAELPIWINSFLSQQNAQSKRWYIPVFSITNRVFSLRATLFFLSQSWKCLSPWILFSKRMVWIGCFWCSITHIREASK